MNGNLIDTNIVIKVLNGNKAVIEYFNTLETIYISAITVGELCYGAFKSSKREYNLNLFDNFINEYIILGIDSSISKIYGDIKYSLISQGRNIPENDMWIAASAIMNNLTLVTCDGYFKDIDKLNSVFYIFRIRILYS